MYHFHISIHRRPSGDVATRRIDLAGGQIDVLTLAPQQVTLPMAVRFEEACERLSELPQMFVEPDGSFVWTSRPTEPRWQADGVLYDRNDRLLFVDLKGYCPIDQFDALLPAFGWPNTPLVFQLSQEAVFLDEAEFRRYALRGK